MDHSRQGETEKIRLFGIIKSGWFNAGQQFEILGDSINVNGMQWTPVLYNGEEDPDFLKTDAIHLSNYNYG